MQFDCSPKARTTKDTKLHEENTRPRSSLMKLNHFRSRDDPSYLVWLQTLLLTISAKLPSGALPN